MTPRPVRMLPEDMQKANEYRFARAHIDHYVRAYLAEDSELMALVQQGVEIVQAYMDETYSYESKNIRINQIRHLDLNTLVFEVFVASAYCQRAELFTSFTAKLAGYLHFDEKEDSIKTIAELTAVLSDAGVYSITKASKIASLMVESNITLTQQLTDYVANCTYMPPLVCLPKKLTKNRQTVNLTTANDSLILRNNHHEGDICLDVINSRNATALRLDEQFLSCVEEEPNKPFETMDQQANWDVMKKQSYEHYKLMWQQGNCFYLAHKVDKRGRIYAQGYHITTQGSPFKKAAVELHKQTLVEGVPDYLRID